MALIVSKQDFVSSISTGAENLVPLYTSKAPHASMDEITEIVLMCLNFVTSKIINFPFWTNEKLNIFGIQKLKHNKV